ncbi:MAG: glycosyltransferase [Alphaproteobacteria bacterium]|nr:glycosyltransferase [Alphaproteobacteria bacterium]
MIHPDNAIHGLWIGRELSKLEKLTLLSFLKHGHEFNLWVYDELDEPLPSGVTLRDAATILPRERIFLKSEADPSGVGRGSYGPFSDLFRYKLLHDEGGIWVDMDLTCLRAFDFAEPYVFRAHQIGLIGNLIKVPKGSELMRRTFEQADRIADENVSWLALNKTLRNAVHQLQLDGFIRKDIVNEGSLEGTIARFAGSAYRAPPPNWYGIHWGNEFWGTKTANHSASNGTFATKNHPAPGSLLEELYRSYGLVDSRAKAEGPTRSEPSAAEAKAILSAATAEAEPRREIAMLVPTLARGGAERIVLDIAAALAVDPDIHVRIYVRSATPTSHEVRARPNLEVRYLDDPGAPGLMEMASSLVARGNPLIFTHLIKRHDLEVLWRAGLLTVPVVHNSRQGWGETPAALDHANVPFIIACADSVKAEIEREGATAPVVTLRHEIASRPKPADLAKARKKIRSAWGIEDDTLLIGMVGQFKSQKAYTRAVRVLARVQEILPAKLMIVGGWDHKYGAGRTTYEATMGLAVELGVVADLICVGETTDPVPFLAAFDVFLNTSIFEGLSVSILEAMVCGCPLVVSEVGGVAEIAPPDAVLVKDPADIEAYVDGIVSVATRDIRALPPAPVEPDLVPRMWLALAKVATALSRPCYPEANGTLFVIDGLHLGGPAISLARILAATRRRHRVGIATLRGAPLAGIEDELREAGASLHALKGASQVSRAAAGLLEILARGNYRSVCFWNAPPELKLLLAKLLSASRIAIADVSPGPMLFDELDAAKDFARRIAFTSDQYFARLDRFVALHASGVPDVTRAAPRLTHVVPLGAPPPPRYVPLPPAPLMLPERIDTRFAIGTVTRLVPYKRVELLLEAMAILSLDVPGASLTIVGAPDATSADYAAELKARAKALGLDNVFFAGSYLDVNRFLALWRVFVLAGERQGCPNASLEAMAMGLPVVAFASGGLSEQVVEGKTGWLVETPRQMAAHLKALLLDPQLRRRMANAARTRARDEFSLKKSAEAFAGVLEI